MSSTNAPPFWLSEAAAHLIREAAREALPDETGGVLVGVSVEKRPWVTEAILVPSPKSSPVYYELSGAERRAAVEGARGRDRRQGYIGEWHSHTYDIGPSGLDRETMARLAGEGGEDGAPPVLLIARHCKNGHDLEAHEQVDGGLVPLRVLAAGALPPGRDDECDDRRADDG